jgi:hypothetical protein
MLKSGLLKITIKIYPVMLQNKFIKIQIKNTKDINFPIKKKDNLKILSN